MARLVIENCRIENNFFDTDRWILIENDMILSHCYNVQLQNIIVHRSEQWYRSAIVVINILGISSFINITSHGLAIEYNELNVDNMYNKLLLENYQIPSSTKDRYYDSVIIIRFHQGSYKIDLEVYNIRFTTWNTTSSLFKVTQLSNIFGDFIHFNQCIVEKFNSTSELSNLFYFVSSLPTYESYHQVTFTNCVFKNNKFHRVFTVYGNLNIRLEGCIFKYNQFQVVKMTDSANQNYMAIKNTSFYAITSNSILIYISNALLHLEGPVMFIKMKADRILYSNSIRCQNYIEFSKNVLSFNDHVHYITVQQNTLINMTNNKYSRIYEMIPYHYVYVAHSISQFTAPCYYQYTAEGQELFSLDYQLWIEILTSLLVLSYWQQ